MVSYQIEQYMARWADLSIANSHAGRQSCLQAGFPAKRIVVIPNGIDTDRFDLNPEHGRRVRQELGLHDQDKLVGVVGRLDTMKDHAVFFQAALQIAAARDRVHFLCVGDGEASYRQHLQELARPLGNRLHWLAARQAIEEIYPALDVLVLPSAFGEGFSNVLAEAMACGVPCVATDVGDSGRILDDARAVVPVHDAAAMARAIGYRLDQTVEKEAMRSKICDAYSIARLADRTENALLSLFAVRKC
jgi:glycosyltransferase involved in cell wall biosynthesis